MPASRTAARARLPLALLALGLIWLLGPAAGSALAAAPVCEDEVSLTVASGDDLPIPVDLACSDPDGDPMSAAPVSFPSHGSLAPDGAGGGIYRSVSGYVGPDSFSYRVTANGEQSNTVIVNIDVTPGAGPPPSVQPPECFPAGDQPAFEGRANAISLPCFDPDSPHSLLTVTVVDPPQHGDLSIAPGSLSGTYTAEDEYVGPDSFTFKVSDGTNETSLQTFTLDVRDFPEGNQPPTCPESHAYVEEGESVWLIANCVDPDGDHLGYNLAAPSIQHGTLVGFTPNSVHYRPDPGYTGPDRLGYSAADQYHDPVIFAVDITVLPAGSECCETAPEATPEEPYAASVSSPVPGPVYIDDRATTSPAPTGYTYLGQEFDITAPGATDPDDPLELVFKLDESTLTDPDPDIDPEDVIVHRNGQAVTADCPPTGSRTDPSWWPCIADRQLVGGDLWVTVLTMEASVWNFGVADVADSDDDGIPDDEDNCPEAANPGQADVDEDGIGAACDSKEKPTAKDECKKNGWRAFDGIYTFRNQGDCVSFVATGGKNPPGI